MTYNGYIGATYEEAFAAWRADGSPSAAAPSPPQTAPDPAAEHPAVAVAIAEFRAEVIAASQTDRIAAEIAAFAGAELDGPPVILREPAVTAEDLAAEIAAFRS